MVEATSSGLMIVETMGTGGELLDPKVQFLGTECGTTYRGKYIDRSSHAFAVWLAEGGTYFVRVSSQDPLLPLADAQVLVGFLDRDTLARKDYRRSILLRTARSSWSSGLDPLDDDVVDPEPDGPFDGFDPWQLASAEQSTARSSWSSGLDPLDDDVVDPEPDGPFDEFDPEPLTLAELDWGKIFSELCRQQHGDDDHGDVFRCATPITTGQSLDGEILSTWLDDLDTFVLELREPRTISVESSGTTNLVGTVYDRHGQRLAIDNEGGLQGQFRIVKALEPGRYFVRVSGAQGAQGSYELRLDELSW